MLRAFAPIVSICAMAATPSFAVNVVTDTPVVHSLVSSVLGETGDATVLLDRGGDPHAFQLRPSQARALTDADVVFWVGEELTPWLARALQTTADGTPSVALLHTPGTHLREFGEGHGHEDEHGHGHEDDHAHDHGHDHDDGALDPHAWLDPENAVIWLDRISSELASIDPENAAVYQANAQAASREIEVLASALAEKLSPVTEFPIVTFHDAYGYFEEAFGVEVAGTVALGDAAAPGARHLKELEATFASGKIACVFREPQHDAAIAETVATSAGIRLGTLDPSGTTLEFGPDLYGELMSQMAEAIIGCVTASS